MSPVTRRRSARLASSVAKVPCSPPLAAATAANGSVLTCCVQAKATPELSSVAEREETPVRNASKALDNVLSPTPTARRTPATPVSSTLKPPHDEMHPSKAHPTTSKPDIALHLGFSDIASSRGARTDRHAVQDQWGARMMEEIRNKAAKIKESLVAKREAEADPSNVHGRVIAQPKGKSGRFSAAHMAEFKKMDSIEGHASAWRAQNGRFTPIKSSLKRSPSKAELDGTPVGQNSAVKASASKARPDATPQRPKLSLKRTSTAANLDNDTPRRVVRKDASSAAAPEKPVSLARDGYASSAKRLKKRQEDDASSVRPVSRGNNTTGLAKSYSGLARLMSPTKASLAQSATPVKPTISLVPSGANTDIPRLTKSVSTTSIGSVSRTADLKRRIISPTRFQKPAALGSLTPGPTRIDKELPPIPLTTPRRKLTKRVAFTPDTAKAAISEDSPSPKKVTFSAGRAPLRALDAEYPELDEHTTLSKSSNGLYPDLSPLKRLIQPQSADGKARTASVPGKFTFRSDHTIKFGDSSANGFGASPGQASIRHLLPGTAHGIANKKRHRASSDEEDAENEAAERAAKKRKHETVPEGQALLAPRLVGASAASSAKKRLLGRTPTKTPSRAPAVTPSRTPASATPSKRGAVLSLSRLNMLARPKNRG
ncbi:hypothetical protein ACCO45_001813 [Purpureocillium lilacinum]|uniref:Uncharacterized protein n=1 Tax=Purpureocillium lilacinum TaxID=33203 RepID=A0ACC4E9F9_PURLI